MLLNFKVVNTGSTRLVLLIGGYAIKIPRGDDNSIMIVPDEMHRVKIRIALCLACDDVNKSKLTDIFISNYDSFSNGENY